MAHAISNFGELKAAIQNWAARTDQAFVNRLPDFIYLAEDRIYQGGRAPLESPAIRASEMVTTADLTVTNGVAPLPDRYLEAIRIYFEGQPDKKLKYMSPRDFHTSNPSQRYANEPVWYTVEGNTFLVQDAVSDGTGKIGYYQRFEPLGETGDSDTNPLLTNYPSLYLHAAMVQAFAWARNSAMATEHFALYSSVAEGLQQASTRSERSGESLAPIVLNAV